MEQPLEQLVTVTSGHVERKKNPRCKYSIYLITINKFWIYYRHHIVNQIVKFALMKIHIFSKLFDSQHLGTTRINE